jgi:hypothetical protein
MNAKQTRTVPTPPTQPEQHLLPGTKTIPQRPLNFLAAYAHGYSILLLMAPRSPRAVVAGVHRQEAEWRIVQLFQAGDAALFSTTLCQFLPRHLHFPIFFPQLTVDLHTGQRRGWISGDGVM